MLSVVAPSMALLFSLKIGVPVNPYQQVMRERRPNDLHLSLPSDGPVASGDHECYLLLLQDLLLLLVGAVFVFADQFLQLLDGRDDHLAARAQQPLLQTGYVLGSSHVYRIALRIGLEIKACLVIQVLPVDEEHGLVYARMSIRES